MRNVAFFEQVGENLFRGNDPARGPWSADHCHAGPVTGLIARAAEAVAGPNKVLTRLTVDFVRPLPLAGLRVQASATRETRTLTTGRVEVHDRSGTLCAQATTMHLARKSFNGMPTPELPPPDFHGAVKAGFPVVGARHDLPMFRDFIEVAYPPGETSDPGPTTIWMRVPPLLAEERPSPIQSMCPLADCGNGTSSNARMDRVGFVNTDLTLQVVREPRSEWLASAALSHWADNGVGMSHATLFDRQGPVGVALQTIVLRPAVDTP